MTPDTMRNKEDRIRLIRKQIEEIPAMLEGSLLVKHNRVTRKDGRVHVSPEYLTFQYRGADAKRKWKRIPRKAKATVERLIRSAKRYRKLEQEYTALFTELSLAHDGKKNG